MGPRTWRTSAINTAFFGLRLIKLPDFSGSLGTPSGGLSDTLAGVIRSFGFLISPKLWLTQ